MAEGLASELPADGAIAQRRYRIRDASVDERLRADNAARATGAVDDHSRLWIGRYFTDSQHEFRSRYADGGWNAHGLELIEATRIDHDDISTGIEQPLHFLRRQRRGVAPGLDQFTEGLAGHIDVAEDLATSSDPPG
jgi:hypothetical protein